MRYVPAILITLYDGYYIYSPGEYSYISKTYDENEQKWKEEQQTGYTHILKPYVYYSARYQESDEGDYVIVNYSLDNYITIYGMVNNEVVSKSGYLTTQDNLNLITDTTTEILTERIRFDKITVKDANGNSIEVEVEPYKSYNFIYNNGRKVYNISNKAYFLNDMTLVEANDVKTNGWQDKSAQNYKTKAQNFMEWLNGEEGSTGNKVKNLVTPQNAVKIQADANGNLSYVEYTEFANDDNKILDVSKTYDGIKNDPENDASLFNQHKREIIKASIQDNLNNAMAIYNANSGAMGTNASFSMPKLSEQDWDKILNNVNFVTFMQGLSLGNKVYNNYSIVSSSNNKQYVRKDSIYIVKDGEYHTPDCEELENSDTNTLIGYKSVDFKKVKYEAKNDSGGDVYKYYYRRPEYACYKCIVNSSTFDLSKLDESGYEEAKRAYYTALARERYNLDKVTKKLINYDNSSS